MKKSATRLAVVCLAVAFSMCSALGVSAENYVANVVDDDFSSATECEFLAPGDLNGDGSVNAIDSVELRKLMLSDLDDKSYDAVYASEGDTAKYSDVNGDDNVDIKDLVRQKKELAENFVLVSNGAMSLNGNSAYSGEFISVMGTGATYEISYSYESEASIKIIINGLGDEIIYENDAVSELTSVTYTLKTPLSIDDVTGIELQIIGVGTVEDFSVTRINMDNELVESW